MQSFRQAEQGAALFIAMVMLVVMAMASVSLLRSTDVGTLIAGNLAFKKAATSSADQGIEAAIGVLIELGGSATGLHADRADNGYFATMQEGFSDFTGQRTPGVTADDFPWAGAVQLGANSTGNSISYVIHRMCRLAGAPEVAECVSRSSGAREGGSQGTILAGETGGGADGGGDMVTYFYRVSVRVTGPQNTVSVVQSTVEL